MKLYQWQEDVLKHGLKKGQMHIFAAGRRTGKSIMAAAMIAEATFTGPWSDWKETFVWPWHQKKSVTGKKIWGHVKTREHKLALSYEGKRIIQYATDKQIFHRTLQGISESW